nr:site-specific integrase [Shewanella aestuarii]
MSQAKTECESGKNLYQLGVLTGLRISELLALNWESVDLAKSLLHIKIALVDNIYKTPKTAGSVRKVELCEPAIALLTQQHSITGHKKAVNIAVLQADNKTKKIERLSPVFYNSKTNKPFLHAKQFNKTFFTPLLKIAGVAHRGAGQLRHTFASQALTAGISKEWIAKQLGHTSTAMIDIHYGRWMSQDAPDHIAAVAEQFSSVFRRVNNDNKAVQSPPSAPGNDIALTPEQLKAFLQQHPKLLMQCVGLLLEPSDGGGCKMKIIRAFFGCLNFSYNIKGRRTAKSSLIHSLRLNGPSISGVPYLDKMQKYFRTRNELQAEWNASLSDDNLIDTKEGIVPLNSISQEQRIQILQEVLGETAKTPGLYEKQSQDKAKSKSKLKQWLVNGSLPPQIAELVGRCIASTDYIDAKEMSAEFNQFEFPRKNQKLKQLNKFISSHNALIGKPKTLNSTNIQEILLKIPIKYGISEDEISHVEMMNAMKLYLKTFFPEYPIKLMVLHHDERLPTEKTGGHVHVFLSAQNSITGKYDLRVSQIKRVNEFLIKRGDAADCLPESGRLLYIQASEVYSYMQQMFYEFINANLFHKNGLHLELSPASERNSELRKKMRADARLPKHQREFNYYNRVIEEFQKQAIELEEQCQSMTERIENGEQTLAKLHYENKELQQQNLDWQQKTWGLQNEYKQLLVKRDNIGAHIQEAQTFIREQASVRDQLDVEIESKYAEVNKLIQVAAEKQKEVIELGEEIGKRQAVLARLKELTNQAIQPIQQMISKLMMRFGSKDSSKAKYYFNLVIDVFDDKLSPVYRDISIGMAKALGDNELEAALIKKNKKLTNNSPSNPYQ